MTRNNGPFFRQYIAINPHTGCVLRAATADEIAAYERANPDPVFARNTRIGDIVIGQDHGPGVNFGDQPLNY